MMTIENIKATNTEISELVSMIETADHGIIICTYDTLDTLDFFCEGLKKFNLSIGEIRKDENTSLTDVIQENYRLNSGARKIDVISIIYDGHLPTYEYLTQIRSYYNKLNCVVIFWFFEYCVPWLFRHAPDFMRVRSGLFEFKISDAIRQSSFLKITHPIYDKKHSDVMHKIEKLLDSVLKEDRESIRKILGSLGRILTFDYAQEKILEIAPDFAEMNYTQFDKMVDLVDTFYIAKGRNSPKEISNKIEFYKYFSEECQKRNKITQSLKANEKIQELSRV